MPEGVTARQMARIHPQLGLQPSWVSRVDDRVLGRLS